MEGCSKTSARAGATSGLPDDPLVEILSRLPAKSVCRFKCVSKAWRDLIADPDHRKKLRQAMQGLFVQTGRASFSFLDLTVRSVPLDIDPCFSFLKEMSGIETFFFVDSCNGLILFGRRQEPSHLSAASYMVCNPTTKHWSAVPACGSREALILTYLAFDPAVSSHFHLVQFQMPDVEGKVVALHVYLSETGTWSQNQIDDQKQQGQLQGWHHQYTLDTFDHLCAFVNGFLHLLVWDSDGQHVLAIDVQGNARRVITPPVPGDGSEYNFNYYLGQSQGHLHCVTRDSTDEKNVKVSTWVLQDYDTQKWVLKNTLNSLDVLGETGEMPGFELVDFHQDCNVVFFFNYLSRELIAYDMDRKEVTVMATFKDDKERRGFARYIPCFSESLALTNKY